MAHFHVPTLPRPSGSFNFTTDVVDYWAKAQPSLVAMLWVSQDQRKSRSLSYSYFSERSHRGAVLLESLGLRKGDRLIIVLPRIPEWWEIVCAAIRAGIIVCPCTTLAVDKDIQYRVRLSQAKGFVGDGVSVAKFLNVSASCPTVKVILQMGEKATPQAVVSYSAAMSRVPADAKFCSVKTDAEDDCLIYFTSGTTGNPKMVLHTQISYPLAHTLTGKRWLALSPGKTYWNLSEQGWAKAAWSFFGAWNCGATLFVHDDRRPFNAQFMIGILHTFEISTLCAPPTVYRQLVSPENQKHFERLPPKALQDCVAAGEPLSGGVIDTWRQMTGGIEIRDGYGQTETIMVCGNIPGVPIKPGSMGKPTIGVPLCVINDKGEDARTHEEGDIAILCTTTDNSRSDFFGLFRGYVDAEGRVKRPEYSTPAAGKSWYRTGDRAYRDEDGYFWFVGRSDDIINSAGYRIGPFEVESTLKLHPAVLESAVVSSPDPIRMEVVKAFIVLNSSFSAHPDKEALKREIQEFCKQHAAPYKYPRKIEFVDASFLPKTTSGKIQRALLRKAEFRAVQRQKL